MALSDSPRNRKLLANAVGMVLAGNVVALFVVGDGGDATGGPLDGPTPAGAVESGAPETPEPRTITLITNADGSKVVVDPATPEGQRLIERAKESGGTVATVPAPGSTSTTAKKGTTTTAAPRTATNGGGGGGTNLPIEAPDLGSTVTSLVGEGQDLIEKVGETGSDLVDDATDLTPIPEDDAVVDPVVDGVVTTVVTTVQGALDTVNDGAGAVTTNTTLPSGGSGLLNGLVAEATEPVAGTVEGVTGGGGLLGR